MGSSTTDWVPEAYQMAAVGGIRMEFLCVVLRGEYYVMQIGLCFYFAISTIDVADKNSIVVTDRLCCFDLILLKRRKTTCVDVDLFIFRYSYRRF